MLDTNYPDYFTREFLAGSRVISLSRGETLFHTDDRVTGIYYVLSGEVKAVRRTPQGSEAVMMRARPGDYFAESALAIDCYVCDALCTTPARVLFLPKHNVLRAMGKPAFATAFALALAGNARRQCSRYERLRLHKAKDRVLHLLICEADESGTFNWPSSLIELAGELGMEPETLYRVLGELEAEGLLYRNRRELRLRRKVPA